MKSTIPRLPSKQIDRLLPCKIEQIFLIDTPSDDKPDQPGGTQVIECRPHKRSERGEVCRALFHTPRVTIGVLKGVCKGHCTSNGHRAGS